MFHLYSGALKYNLKVHYLSILHIILYILFHKMF